MVINTSLSAADLTTSQASLAKPLAQLALTDTSSTASTTDLSASLDTQFSGINAAQSSAANAISFTQSQNALLQNVGKALDEMGQLATAAQNPSATTADRATDNQQFQSLSPYITQTAGQNFNGVSLFSANGLSVSTDGNGGTTTLPGINLNGAAYTAATSSDISTPLGPPASGATGALASVQAALKQLSSDSTTAKSNLSQLGSLADQLAVSSENLSAANGIASFEDAQQSTADAGNSMLNDSSIALLTQANQLPQSVLDLLQQ